MEIICPICNTSFEPKRSDAIYCKAACKKKAKRMREKKTEKLVCIICGSTFTPKHGNQKYCKDECKETARLLDMMHNHYKRKEIYKNNDGSWDD